MMQYLTMLFYIDLINHNVSNKQNFRCVLHSFNILIKLYYCLLVRPNSLLRFAKFIDIVGYITANQLDCNSIRDVKVG